MGRTKNYLRYVQESTFGLVTASQAGSSIKYLRIHNTKDRFVAAPANENVYIWDLKTRQVINKMQYDLDSAAEVATLECYHGGHPRTNLIAVGYANGHVKLFEYETGMLKSTFTGHRTTVTSLAFDRAGSRLASGGKDCNIVLWDIVGERGLFSLKGHKNSISKLAFLYNDEHQKDLLISSSVDVISAIKFWDLQLQHCFYTLPGHVSGVWSFVLLNNGSRIVTGSTGPELRVYSIKFLSEFDNGAPAANASENDNKADIGTSGLGYGIQVSHLGNILRNSTAVSNRVQDLVVDPDESLMLCHSVDKHIELYSLRSPQEALTYAKKQTKKAKRKQTKRKRQSDGDMGNDDQEEDDGSEMIDSNLTKPVTCLEDLEPQRLVDCEFNRKFGSEKLSDKIRSVDVLRIAEKDGSFIYKLAVMLSSNKIDCISFDPSKSSKDARMAALSSVESLSHRTDARSVAISADNTLILSASAESAKIWRLDSGSCTTTIEIDHATCCVFSNAQFISETSHKNRFAIIGTKKGCLQVINIADAEVTETINVCEEGRPVSSICNLPDKTGIACGGEDGVLRFFNYAWTSIDSGYGHPKINLSLEASRTLEFQEGITCVNVSSNNNLLAVALLDSTVRVHFVDTFKYFLTMYGHKFPVITMDISDDNNLLVTGSPDKNIKIWGLDFGDCHKSIFAHDDTISCVKFVPKTHHVFSGGRDGQIKQWDCDHFIRIQSLRKHQAEVWCLAISSNGKYLVTSSHDRSLRVYRRTEEILVPSEEEEAERELEDERNVFEKQDNIVVGDTNPEAGFASKMTMDSVKSTDRLIEAIDVFLDEQAKESEYKRQCQIADDRGEKRPAEPERSPLLMTVMTDNHRRFMLEVVRRMKSSELEEILITLPFDYVRKLLVIVTDFLDDGWDVELMVRCAVFLLKVNFGQIAAAPALAVVVQRLKNIIMEKSIHLRDSTGFNLLALEHLAQHRRHQSTNHANIVVMSSQPFKI